MTKHFATLSDGVYTIFGLALYESIQKYITSDFVLHYLALDEQSYEVVRHCDNIKAYPLSTIANDPMYETLKKHNRCVPSGWTTYHWALGSFFTNYIMETQNPPHCMYADADIFFYRDPNEIFECVKNYSIGVMTHKHRSPDMTHPGGYFNVGVIYFRNDNVGKRCLKWWHDVVADTHHELFAKYGHTGDQRYLELFGPKFGAEHIKIIDTEIGHAAPWNFYLSRVRDGKIDWMCRNVLPNKEHIVQDLVFNHFSHFTPNYENDTYKFERDREWSSGLRGGIKLLNIPGIQDLYDNYFEVCKDIKKRYKL